MLGTLLDQIPGAFSRRFLLGHFLPLVLFCIASLALAHTCFPQVQSFAAWFEARPVLMQGFIGAAAALSLAAIALALSGFKTLGRLALEGSVLPASWREKLEGLYGGELKEAKELIESARIEGRLFESAREAAISKLKDARKAGISTGSLGYNYPTTDTISIRINKRPADPKELSALVDELAAVLTANSLVSSPDLKRLDHDHGLLVELLEKRSQALIDAFRRAEVAMQRDFPGARAYATRFARVAGSLRAYAEERYGVDYAVLWPRLEAVTRKEEPPLFEALQDASAQLNFYITMFWLTAAFVLAWSVILAAVGFNTWLFLCVAFGGPILCFAWYELGVRSYYTLADEAFTAVDLVRLKVFDALGVAQPKSPAQEREYWAKLGSSLAFGGQHDVPYRKRESPPPPRRELNVRLRIEPGSALPRNGS